MIIWIVMAMEGRRVSIGIGKCALDLGCVTGRLWPLVGLGWMGGFGFPQFFISNCG